LESKKRERKRPEKECTVGKLEKSSSVPRTES